MATITYNNDTARQLTADISRKNDRAAQQQAVNTCTDASSLYTNVSDIADAATNHDGFFNTLGAAHGALAGTTAQIEAMAASFDGLDAQQAREINAAAKG